MMIAGGDPLVYQQYDTPGRPSVFYRWAQGTWGPYTAFAYDGASRPNAHQLAFMNGVNNIWSSYAYNPASQLTSRWSNTDAYAFNGYVNVNRTGSRTGVDVSGCKTLDGYGVDSSYGTNRGTKMVSSQRISQTDGAGNSNTDLVLQAVSGYEQKARQGTVDSNYTREFGVTLALDPKSKEWVVSLFQGPRGNKPLLMAIGDGQRLAYAAHTHRGLGTSRGPTNLRNDYSLFFYGRNPVVTGPSPGRRGDLGMAERVRKQHSGAQFGVWYQEHDFFALSPWKFIPF